MILFDDESHFSSYPISERDMQEEVCQFLLKKKFTRRTSDNWRPITIDPIVVKEFRIPEIKRRSDIVLYLTPRKVINIECKLFDMAGALAQARDHQRWAHYSMICIPHNVYIPNYHKMQALRDGIGLITWIPKTGIVELFNASQIKCKHPDLRKRIIKRFKEKHVDNQELF